MALVTYITGDQATLTITGTGAPTSADAFRFFMRVVRPEKIATPYGSTCTRFRNTRPTGRGYIEFMVKPSTLPPVIPANTVWTVAHKPDNSMTETLDILCVGRSSGSDNWGADTQVVRYDFVLDTIVTNT